MKTINKRLLSFKNSSLSRLALVFIAIIIAGNSQAQTTPPPTTPPSLLPPFNCAIEEGASGGLRSTPCIPSSDTWLNDYRTPGHWIPDSSTPLKTIKVNWIVCQDDDGNGWQDIPDFHNRVDEFFTELNSRFSNIPIKGYQLTCDPNATHIVDSKIRFELGEIYFLPNDDWYNLGRFNSVTPLLDHLFTIHPEARTGLNHIFSNGSGADAFGMYTWSNGESIVRTFSDNPLMFSDWWMPMEWVGHIAHEYGHALGVLHDYESPTSEVVSINHYDFLDDVFGTCAEPILLSGGACHTTCNAGLNEICYFNSCFLNQFPESYSLMSGGMEDNHYISPKSIGRFHRALSLYDETFRLNNKNMHRYVIEKYSYTVPKEITQDETWDFGIKMYQDIIVKSGITLTVTCEVLMPVGGKIIVEPGATLIIDGGRIMNAHDEMWQGIEVAGDTDEHQYSFGGGNYHQGRLILMNGAIIENARNGARNMLGNDWGARGGIIQATNSSFINCRKAVEFMSYQNFSPSNSSINRPDQSYFRECLFELNDDYLLDQDAEPPAPRITLWETDRVRISGCQLINTSTVSETVNRSIAVYSHDANYSITERCLDNPQQYGVCNNEVPSLFKGWYKAVEALETSSGRPIVVRKSIFEENMIGVEINGTSFSEIYQNEFLVGDHPFPEFADEAEDTKNHLGIHVIETTHYAVEENDVEKPSGATYEGNGVLVYNSKGAENAVYKNQFTNLQTGAESDWINRNINYTGGVPAGLAGLQFLCNQNSGNNVDFRISRNSLTDQSSSEYLNSGTRQDHGSNQPDRPAKNAFSSPDSDPFNYVHFTVNSEFAYKYFYDSNPPSMNEITPGTFVAPILVSNAQGCPSNYTTGFVDLPIKHELNESQDGFNGLLFTYQETIDQGNTPAMITEIDLAYPSEAWDMRNTLLARSPYNSEQVLIAAALREIMPHSMLLEVLLANPDALRSGNVIRVVSNQLTNPLPQYMIDMLYAVRDQTTLRTIMETTLADLNFERQRIYKRLVNSKFFLDDQLDEPDSVIYYLTQINTLESNIARAAAYSDRNQFSAATTLLDSMIVHFKLDQAQVDELQALKTLYGLIGTAESQGRNIAQLESSEIASLTAIAYNDDAGLAQNKAENALCFHYGICPAPIGTPKNNATPKPKPTKKELVEKLNTSAAYPNPATDFVTIEFDVLFARENTRLSVFDPLGREVESRILGMNYQGQELFDTRNWGDGLYIYSITQDDELIETGKFTIIR